MACKWKTEVYYRSAPAPRRSGHENFRVFFLHNKEGNTLDILLAKRSLAYSESTSLSLEPTPQALSFARDAVKEINAWIEANAGS